MNRSIFALVAAFGIMPVAGLAQDTNSPTAPTADQRQAMRQTFQQFAQQEKQLHQQMRSQILSSLSPVHLRSVAATIGELAIEQNPDPQAAAKRLDQLLSPGERQRILAAHSSFDQQSRQLHEQMRTQLQSEMPAGQPSWTDHGQPNGAMAQRTQFDAGTVLLMALSPHPMLGMMGMAHGPGMMHMEVAPPQ
jgi:outer membrane translocation and assembly module TamA